MHEMKVSDVFVYLVPSMSIVIGMTATLSYSFWKYHKRKMAKRKMQHDYLEVFLSVKRPRIGALRCNTHFTKWTDMAQSLSHSDFNRLSRYHTASTTSRCPYNIPPGSHFQNGQLGQIKEEYYNRPIIEINYALDNDSLSSSIPGETYKRNSYYEDRGLPPVPRKHVKKTVVQDERRPSLFSTSFNLFSNTTKSSSDSELGNRRTEIQDSPRQLGHLEDGYWKRDSSRSKKSKHRKHSKRARCLSQQYEYDLNLPELLRQNQENKVVNLDIYTNKGTTEHYIIPDLMYNESGYQVSNGETRAFDHLRNLNSNSGLQNLYYRDRRTINTKYDVDIFAHYQENGLQRKFHRTGMAKDKYNLSESTHYSNSKLPDQYTSSFDKNGNTHNPNGGLQHHNQRNTNTLCTNSEHGQNSGLHNPNHGLDTGHNKYNINETALVWVNLDDIPQSCV